MLIICLNVMKWLQVSLFITILLNIIHPIAQCAIVQNIAMYYQQFI